MDQPKKVSGNWKALAPLIKKGGIPPKSTERVEQNRDPEVDPQEGLWFEVDETSLRRSQVETKVAVSASVSIIDLFPKHVESEHKKEIGRYIAMDCEMVGVGPDGNENALARVSLVNFHGQVLLDKYVRPIEKVTDYRTHVSGIKPHHLVGATNLAEVQNEVWSLIQEKILIGHSLKNDFRVLFIEHPRRMTRDTSKYRPFRKISRGSTPSLKRLAKEFLGIDVQKGSHDSVDDARVAMLLYRAQKDKWENYLFRNEGKVIKQQRRMKKKTSKSS